MRSAETDATALAAMLTVATGSDARLTGADAHIRIEADLPDAIEPAARTAILTALTLGTRYGHQRRADGDTVWVEIDRESDAP